MIEIKVKGFIESHIFRNSIFTSATDEEQYRAINQSKHILLQRLPKYFPTEDDIPADILAHQTIWVMQVDDTFARAEMGATYIQMSGVMVSIKDRDRTIAPYVLGALGITPDAVTGGLTMRKVGRYAGRNVGTDLSNLRG